MRITERDLNILCDRVNDTLSTPMASYVMTEDGRSKSQIGNYHISNAYGGVSLHQMTNECGGVREVFSSGHMPKKELYGLMHAFLAGIESSS